MKKVVSLLVVLVMTLSIFTVVQAEEYMYVYAPDGRSEYIKVADFYAWHEVGWYSAPVMYVYALDGRSQLILTSDFTAWNAVGWYDAPVMYVYNTSDEQTIIRVSEFDYHHSHGWYSAPVVRVYAPDGRSEVILKQDLQAWINVGWSQTKFVTMYSPYGKKVVIKADEIEKWEKSGWIQNIAEKEGTVFVENARKSLGVPDGIGYKYEMNQPVYWEAGGFWTVYIMFTSPRTGEVIAGASFDIYRGEPARSILNYMPENY